MQKKWEYRTIGHTSAIDGKYDDFVLNEQGEAGWELCGVSSPATNWGSWYYHYKREIIEKTNQQ